MTILEILGTEAVLEQLAEEASELSQAGPQAARGEPYPKDRAGMLERSS